MTQLRMFAIIWTIILGVSSAFTFLSWRYGVNTVLQVTVCGIIALGGLAFVVRMSWEAARDLSKWWNK